jgi:2-desacetyl-2-hydroxyethyl bacteriochlorophyllide A dehydrogenase
MKTYPMAFISAPGIIEFREQPMRDPKPDEVMIKVRYAAICGSDLHLFRGKHPSVQLPSAVGHELSGEVIKTGSEVTHFAEGDQVTVEPILACGKCDFCLHGQYHLCANVTFQYRQGQGAFTNYFYAPENRIYHLPDHLNLMAGALIEPLSVALHAVKKSGIRLGNSAAVFGAGAIGLLVCALVSRTSGRDIYCMDISDFRLEKALEMGASRTINSSHENALQCILSGTNGMGVDLAFEAVGREETLSTALQSVRKGGEVVLLGIFEETQIRLPVHLFVQREISLAGSQGYAWDFDDAIRLASSGAVPLGSLITHTVHLEELGKGFDLLVSPGNKAVKVLIEMPA